MAVSFNVECNQSAQRKQHVCLMSSTKFLTYSCNDYDYTSRESNIIVIISGAREGVNFGRNKNS